MDCAVVINRWSATLGLFLVLALPNTAQARVSAFDLRDITIEQMLGESDDPFSDGLSSAERLLRNFSLHGEDLWPRYSLYEQQLLRQELQKLVWDIGKATTPDGETARQALFAFSESGDDDSLYSLITALEKQASNDAVAAVLLAYLKRGGIGVTLDQSAWPQAMADHATHPYVRVQTIAARASNELNGPQSLPLFEKTIQPLIDSGSAAAIRLRNSWWKNRDNSVNEAAYFRRFAKAMDAYEALAQSGDVQSMVALGDLTFYPGATRDSERGHRWLEAACETGYLIAAESCIGPVSTLAKVGKTAEGLALASAMWERHPLREVAAIRATALQLHKGPWIALDHNDLAEAYKSAEYREFTDWEGRACPLEEVHLVPSVLIGAACHGLMGNWLEGRNPSRSTDKRLTLRYAELGARHNNPAAIHTAGTLYGKGDGLAAPDYEKALSYYRYNWKAFQSAPSAFHISIIYFNGFLGGSDAENRRKGMLWVERAAASGSLSALIDKTAYLSGSTITGPTGVVQIAEPNYYECYVWARVLMRRGVPEEYIARDDYCKARLSDAQRAQADIEAARRDASLPWSDPPGGVFAIHTFKGKLMLQRPPQRTEQP
ncbi:hypothetical protein OAS86_03785 [Gammaproteobacteria bacterium]|nr:hypothetical protein [Gammaproteobacteria bacterium]